MKKTGIIEVPFGRAVYSVSIQYQPSNGKEAAKVLNICLRPAIRNIDLEGLEIITQSIRNYIDSVIIESDETSVVPVFSNELALKPSVGFIIKKIFTTKSDQGKVELLNNLRKMSEFQMNEGEKKAAKGILAFMFDFIRAGK